jgi:nucleotide-binding universal stress UspA family protein
VVYACAIPIAEILFATDFSEPSRRALACARQIALRRGVLLRALHVVDVMSGGASAGTSFNSAIESARRALRVNRRQLRLAGIREAATVIFGGSISLAIRDALIRYHSTLLVMGLYGEPGITIPTFGGNVRRLFRSAPCPMLTIGLRGPDNPSPAFARVLYVTDIHPDSFALAQNSWPLDADAAALAHFVVLPPEGAPEADASIDVRSGLAPLRLVAHHQAAGLILAFAAEAQADLIVIAIRGASYLDLLGLGSVIRTVWSKGACPMLTARTDTDRVAPLRERFAAIRNRKPPAS